MDWSKLNWDEVFYYCKSRQVDFACWPFSAQLEQLVLIFCHYGVRRFTVQDIQAFYRRVQVPKWKGEGPLKPAPAQIRAAAGRMQNLRSAGDTFEIVPAETGRYLPFDPRLYLEDIERGYREGRIYPGCFQTE